MSLEKPRALVASLLLTLTCAAQPSSAQSPFPGRTFTYSYPPADIQALTAHRATAPSNRNDLPIVIKGWHGDISDPSFIFFSTGNDCRDTEIYPVIAVHKDNEWRTISFTGARNHYWSHVYLPSPFEEGQRIFAVSRGYCGEPHGRVYIYRSLDGGESWTVSSIGMYYLSDFLALRMEADGSGEIIVQSDNDADPIGGLHVYRTFDWGDNWSEPEFSPTILAPAARPSEFFDLEMIRARPFRFQAPEYVPIPQIMESIAAEYAQYLGRQ